MGIAAASAVGIAAIIDGLIGEPPDRIHPVALFGRLVDPFDREWRSPRIVGIFAAIVLPLCAAVVGWGLVTATAAVSLLGATVVAGLVLVSTLSLRLLVRTAGSVIEATDTDIDGAREAVPALVGRDPDTLSAAELRSAAVESAAENLADGLVAPLLAFVLGAQLSIGVGVAAAMWVKAVNTLDSMLGYRSKPVGWASARLDDVVMFVPARVAAVVLACAAGRPGALWTARRWAGAPPSPNSGWPMATLATTLDIGLVKPGVYELNPAAALPSVADGRRAVRIVAGGGVLSVLAGGVLAWW